MAGDEKGGATAMQSEGECGFCKKVFSGNGMGKHLLSCAERTKMQSAGGGRAFLVKAAAGPFLVYFYVDSSSTLKMVDSFLRDLWLECCGHLSVFQVEGVTYAYQPQSEYGDKSMTIKLDGVLRSGLSFTYEYDFGTITELTLKCLSEQKGKVKGAIGIAARNSMPEINFSVFKKPSKEISS